MGFAENMRIWSGINCGLASLVGYTQMKSNGVDTNIAIWAVMFHGLVDTIYFRPQLQFMFWTYVAVISALIPTKKAV